MLCKNCGTEFNDTSSFCPVCGTPAQQSNPNPSMENTAYTMPNNGAYTAPDNGYTMPNNGTYTTPDNGYTMPNNGAYTTPDNGYTMPNNGGYTMPNGGMYDPMPRQQVTSFGQYLGWFLLSAIPFGIGFIISIVFACRGENKNRANFFRAMLIFEAIVIALFVVIIVIGIPAGYTTVTGFDAFDHYDSYLAIASILGL